MAEQQMPPMMEEQKPKKRARPAAKVRAPPPPAAAAAGKRVRGDQEARDEDVDRFFALLADLREMRELRRRNGGGAPKRTRADDGRPQQLWRPTFVLEDFAFELKGAEGHTGKNMDGEEKSIRA